MKIIKLNKRRQLQLHLNNLLNKKSNYLKNLEKINNTGIKIENEKVDILTNQLFIVYISFYFILNL